MGAIRDASILICPRSWAGGTEGLKASLRHDVLSGDRIAQDEKATDPRCGNDE